MDIGENYTLDFQSDERAKTKMFYSCVILKQVHFQNKLPVSQSNKQNKQLNVFMDLKLSPDMLKGIYLSCTVNENCTTSMYIYH